VNQELRTQPMTPDSGSGSVSTTDVVRDEATGVGQSVKDAGGHVTQTAADQMKEVAAETRQQARDLVHEGRQQLREQAVSGQQRAARGLTTVADELREMAEGSSQSGTGSELARQGADRLHQLASWLENREPDDLIEEVRSFARRRPGAFLVGAVLAGVVAGRLTGGGLAAVRQSGDNGSASTTPVQRGEYPEVSAGYPGSGTAYTAPPSPLPPVSLMPSGVGSPATGTPAGGPLPTPPMDTVPQGGPTMGVAEPGVSPYPDYDEESTYDTGGQVTR